MSKKVKLFFLLLILIFQSQFVLSQSIPTGFNYQAVVRNADGTLMKNRFIEVKITIFNENKDVFIEKYSVNTNEFGLINLVVGVDSEGYNSIDWSDGIYSFKVEINQGSGFEELGSTTFQSVPYAALAKDVVNKDDADADPLNEIQTLTFNSETNELSISSGNSITIPVGGTDADADPLNEIQTISKSNDSIFISKNGGFVIDEVNDKDANPTNELQSLSISGNELSISNGNTVALPVGNSSWIENDSIVSRINGIVEIGNSKRNAKLSINNENKSYGIYCASTTEGTSIFGINRHKTGRTYGGKFTASSIEGIGVAGFNFSYSGKTKAGFFQANSTEGIGVVGKVVNASGRNIGVLGSTNSPEGYAGYFIGDVKIKGELKLGDVSDSMKIGTIRWNDETQDFEGFTGIEWKSLTKSKKSTWGNITSNETRQFPNFNGKEGDYLGCSVSADDGYAAIGKYGAKIGDNKNQGEVNIYKRYNTNSFWGYEGSIISSDGKEGDYFGFSVAVADEYVVVGAPGKKVGDNVAQGKAYVFHRENNKWIQTVELVAEDGKSKSNFGASVAINNDYMVIGAGNMDVEYNKQGKAYVYHREGTNWILQSGIVAPDAEANDYFGYSVSISGDYLVVGAYGKDVEDKKDYGKVYVYHRDDDSWVIHKELMLQYGRANDYFGATVSIDGEYIVIGAPLTNNNGIYTNSGKAYVYKRSGSTWYLQSTISAYDRGKNDYFGRSVSIKGEYVLIGASGKTIGDNKEQGKAYVYKRTGKSWTQDINLLPSDGAADDYFGFSVSISNNSAFVGAAGKKINDKKYVGKVYNFDH